MINLIVIGKNEEWRLKMYFDSINKVVKKDQILDYEILYVDSKSSDNSVENTMSFDKIKVFQITGECNAAVERNSGAKEARGEILVFPVKKLLQNIINK